MNFFLTEILARLLGLFLCADFGQTIWHALGEGKIRYIGGSGTWLSWIIDAMLNLPDPVAHRETNPIMFWMQIVFHVMAMLGCVVLAIFGWQQTGG